MRIADWVVRLTTSTMVQGIDYARAKGAQVLSMSMGGLTSSALVDAVNLAYDHGVVMVTAAGNNFAGVPSPKSIVFPARYQRVLAACGVMARRPRLCRAELRHHAGQLWPGREDEDGARRLHAERAVGGDRLRRSRRHGRRRHLCRDAADRRCRSTLARRALGRREELFAAVDAHRGGPVRAVFQGAAKSTAKMGTAETLEKIGQGVVKADAALAVMPRPESQLRKLPPAEDSWPWLDLVFGGGVSLAAAGAAAQQRRRMLALELTQMAQRVASVDAAIADPGEDPANISPAARNRYLEAALDEGNPSKPLRDRAGDVAGKAGRSVQGRRRRPLRPRRSSASRARCRRRTAGCASTRSIRRWPSGSIRCPVHEATLTVPWDDQPSTAEPLRPGPVGEYLEVVDIDPASNRVYDPVDLNDKMLLAQDGLPPSEGNPQFHQQMVYAVAMTTIGHFERALGRRALWAPHYGERKGADGDMTLKATRCRGCASIRTRCAPTMPITALTRRRCCSAISRPTSKDGDTTTPGIDGVLLPVQRHRRP